METRRHDDGENVTNSTNSSGVISGITELENEETDELGRKILAHERRDRQRMHDAIASGGVQAFKRARPRPGVALTMENLERNNLSLAKNGDDNSLLRRSSEPIASRAQIQTSVSSSDVSNPLNVPSQWGRKGRQKNDFLRRISATASPTKENIDPSKIHDPDVIYRRRPTFTGDSPRSDVDWPMSPEDGLQRSVEQESPLRRTLSYGAASNSPEKKLGLHHMLEQELPSVESSVTKMGVTRRHVINTQQNNNEEVAMTNGSRNRPDRVGGRIPRRRHTSTQLNNGDDGSKPDDAKVEQFGEEDRGNQDVHPSVITSRSGRGDTDSDGQHRQRRSDSGSREILKQLARATSSIPSPGTQRSPVQSKLPTRRENSGLPSKLGQPSVEFQVAPASTLGRPSSPNKLSVPSAPKIDMGNHGVGGNSSPFLGESLLPRTPTVTGAWIDTPAAKNQDKVRRGLGQDSEEIVANSLVNREKETWIPRVRPHPASAADALLREPDNLGDSTIASLRDLLVDSTEDVSNLSPLDDETLNLIENVRTPVTPAKRDREDDRKAEMDTLRKMDERLRAARSGLRDASRGLKRVEREVEDAASTVDEHETRKPGTISEHTHCPRCDEITLSSLFTKAWSWWTSNFIIWDRGKGKRRFPRLTWLGLLCCLLFAWSISEVVLCDFYCHQMEATSMVGCGVNEFAPEMPYVTASVLVKRPLTQLWWFLEDLYDFWMFGRWPQSFTPVSQGPPDMAYGSRGVRLEDDEYL